MVTVRKNQIMLFVATVMLSSIAAFGGWYFVSQNSAIREPGIKGVLLLVLVSAFLFIVYAGIFELLKYKLSSFSFDVVLSFLTFFFAAISIKELFVYNVADGIRYYCFPQIAAIMSVESAALLIHNIRCNGYRRQPVKNNVLSLGNIIPTAIILMFGTFLCISLPVSTGITWDDSIHYERTIMFSQGVYSTASEADLDIIYQKNPKGFDEKEENAAFLEIESTKHFCTLTDAKALLPERICYIGYAIGIWLSRLMGLPYHIQFIVSKIFNLLIYCIIMYAAYSKLHRGKSLLILLGALPTIVFMASGYSYDPWLIGFTSLAFSTFFGLIQEENIVLNKKTIAIMLGSMFLGVLPKAGYSVLFLLLLLMPDNKFANKSQKKKYILLVLAIFALTLAYFLVEYFAFGSMGDNRGGDNVDASAQIKFILSNPSEFSVIILSFLRDYIKQTEYLTGFAYVGQGVGAAFLLASMILFSAVDSKPISFPTKNRIIGLAIIFVFLFFTATALYVDFTPVAHKSVNGCQARYMLPLLFPAFMLALNGWKKIDIATNKKLFYTISCVIGTVVLIASVLQIKFI